MHYYKRLTWFRGEGVGGTEHLTPGLHGIQALPDHSDDRAGSHVRDQPREEGFGL